MRWIFLFLVLSSAAFAGGGIRENEMHGSEKLRCRD
jgi:hypothetical protein